jgi:hypothetical protein
MTMVMHTVAVIAPDLVHLLAWDALHDFIFLFLFDFGLKINSIN